MTKTTKRIKKTAALVRVPQDRIEAAVAIARIGTISRETQRIETRMNDELADLKAAYEAEAEPLRAEVEALTEGLHIWAEANRESLTQGGKVKTAQLPTGELVWRIRPPSVRISGADAVMDVLRRRGLARFIRTKEEISKEAILNEPQAVAGVPGIAISQAEDFVVQPFETELS